VYDFEVDVLQQFLDGLQVLFRGTYVVVDQRDQPDQRVLLAVPGARHHGGDDGVRFYRLDAKQTVANIRDVRLDGPRRPPESVVVQRRIGRDVQHRVEIPRGALQVQVRPKRFQQVADGHPHA